MDGLKQIVAYIFSLVFNCGAAGSVLVSIPNPVDPESNWYIAFKVAKEIYSDYMVPIGMGLMIIWFLVAFVQKSTSEQMNFDQIFLLFVKLIAAFYLITHGMELFMKLWSFGDILLRGLQFDVALETGGGMFGIRNDVLESAWSDLTGGKAWNGGVDPELPGFWRSIGCIIMLILPMFFGVINFGCYTFIIYSRTLEMLLRVTMAPIALSDFFAEGLHSNAWRYMKTFLALCLQGCCIFLIMRLVAMVSAGLITGGGFMDAVVQYFVVSFAAIALMFKSLSFCKELVGA